MSKKHVSLRQLELLLDFMEVHTDLALGRVRSKEGSVLSKKLWAELAAILNSEAGENGFRSAKEWNKFYTDYKCRVRSKARKLAISQNKTGGGASDARPLSELEERLCSIIGPDFDPLPVQINPLVEDVTLQQDDTEEDTLIVVDIIDDDDHVLNLGPNLASTTSQSLSAPLSSQTKRKETEVEKTRDLLQDIERSKLEVAKSRIEVEKAKVGAIESLATAAWALVNIFKTDVNKTPYCIIIITALSLFILSSTSADALLGSLSIVLRSSWVSAMISSGFDVTIPPSSVFRFIS